MSIESLDPRVNRLGVELDRSDFNPLVPMDELETYECFVQLKDSRPFLHVGNVHSPNLEIAFMTGKEQYTRRLTCSGFWVVATSAVSRSVYAKVNQSVYELIENHSHESGSDKEDYAVFHQSKRGAQHKFVGHVLASSIDEAMSEAKNAFSSLPETVNLWIVKDADIYKSTDEDLQIWDMLPEKVYREAFVYKVKNKIDKFKEEQKEISN